MKKFNDQTLDFKVYEKELKEFKYLLDTNDELSEKNQILPFFRNRPTLSSQIGTLIPRIVNTDKLAYEYDIFGDFASDLVVGDISSKTFCFIEFEDARPGSIFVTKRTKYKPEFSNRLEHGISQIIDWFFKLDNQGANDIEERFGLQNIHYEGILVIGRDRYLTTSLRTRLEWRTKNTVINSKHFYCYTFDEIYDILTKKIQLLKMLANSQI